ncbi:WD40 repeat domain-containing protein [Nonomuraea turkmeniaca]|uniref:WD40 repeat domain-containing protein n=1 Tax=Nonomuraea turkmeniaca TaxID=103838 RepID=A0A5S4FAG6_9ACTN|nr:WD40 repeat domain-containing protein [Nonomuraea turkmeniaca]TMR14134.1 WD40 repeat domain-containing protein [Nonomuraea turkmeniaca]
MALLIGAGVPVCLRAHTVSQARSIALDGIKQRGSDWYAAELLGYVAVLTHSDGYTTSALAETLTEERRGFLPGTATVIDVAVSSDGKLALVSDAQEGSGLWRLERDPKRRENLTGSRSTILDRGFGPVALSSDGRIAVIGDAASGDIKMWDRNEADDPKRAVVRTGDYKERLLDVSLSADGMTLFAGFENGSVEVGDSESTSRSYWRACVSTHPAWERCRRQRTAASCSPSARIRPSSGRSLIRAIPVRARGS